MKILICDDSMMIRRQLKNALLTIDSHDVVEAANGAEAIEAYKAHQPQLVFMDIIMPEINGIEAVRGIKNHDPMAKIVMLSSVGTSENLKEAIQAGAVDFMQKPVDMSLLTSTLNKFRQEV